MKLKALADSIEPGSALHEALTADQETFDTMVDAVAVYQIADVAEFLRVFPVSRDLLENEWLPNGLPRDADGSFSFAECLHWVINNKPVSRSRSYWAE